MKRSLLLLWVLATPAIADGQRLSFEGYLRAGGKVYLSEARTAGGVGGGGGLRAFLSESLLLQADLAYLSQIGNVGEVRVGAGWQLAGFWRPGATVLLSSLFGDQLSFLTPQHPAPVSHPALSLGVAISPLRFTHQGVSVSLLELEVGLGLDLPSVGVALGITLLETSLQF